MGDQRVGPLCGGNLTNMRFLSFASMVVPSNDAFIGNANASMIPLFDDMGNVILRMGANGIVIGGSGVWDAGTEVNDEVPAHTPGLAQMGMDVGNTENGVIMPHPGFMGSAALGGPLGNILMARLGADFTVDGYVIARIEIIPAPAGAAVLALGGMVAGRRRRW